MIHGFAVTISTDRTDTYSNFTQKNNTKINITAYHPFRCLSLFTSTPLNSKFVQHKSFGNWFVVSIGDCYAGMSFVDTLEKSVNVIGSINTKELMEKIKNIPGQYCAVCFNHKTHELINITDPSGVRSLFFTKTDKTLIIASCIPMLRILAPGQCSRPNIENQVFLFRYGYSLPGDTVYDLVKEIAPRQVQYINLDNIETLEERPFTANSNITENNNNNIGHTSSDLKDYEDKLLSLMRRTTKQQCGNAKKVGVLLGGFDSALVASILHQNNIEVETYSFHYQEKSYNQPFIDLLSQYLGTTHHWIKITHKVIEDGLRVYGDSCNWPTIWPNYVIQTQHLTRQMRINGVDTCFSGDGCDTAFLGYPSTHKRGQFYHKMPILHPQLAKFLRDLFHFFNLEYIFGHVGRVILTLLDASSFETTNRPLYSFQLFGPGSYRRLTGHLPNNYTSHKDHFDQLLETIKKQSFERKMYFAKSLISPNRCKLVSSSDAAGISIHSPYMHPALIAFAKKLPEDVLRPINNSHTKEGKYLLMKMAEHHNLLPKEIIYQPKLAAIKSPIDSWFSCELREFTQTKLCSLPFSFNKRYASSLLSEQLIEKLYKKHFADDDVVSLAISLLVTYACFFK